jgi:hypothetical protein
MKLQLVILDCDGVLVDSEPTANRVLLDTLVDVGLPIARQECLRTFMGRSTSDCCEINRSPSRASSSRRLSSAMGRTGAGGTATGGHGDTWCRRSSRSTAPPVLCSVKR